MFSEGILCQLGRERETSSLFLLIDALELRQLLASLLIMTSDGG